MDELWKFVIACQQYLQQDERIGSDGQEQNLLVPKRKFYSIEKSPKLQRTASNFQLLPRASHFPITSKVKGSDLCITQLCRVALPVASNNWPPGKICRFFFHKTPCENGIKGHNSGQQTWALDLRDMIVPRSMPEIVARRWRLKSNIQKSWNIENAVCQWLKLSTFKAKSTFKALYQPWIKTAELWKSMTALKPVLETNYYETAEKISQYIHCPRVNYSTQRVQIVGTMQWPEALQYPTHPIPFPANHGTSAVERSFNLLLKITLELVEQWALCWTDSK